MELSKTNQAIILADKKGYKMDKITGEVYSFRTGYKVKLLLALDTKGYLTFGVKLPKIKNAIRVPAHKLMAYKKFGSGVFLPGVVVRHLDNNPLNNSYSNIEIGTQKENLADSKLKFHNKPNTKKFTSEQEVNLYNELSSTGESMTKFGNRHGVSRHLIRAIRRRVESNFINGSATSQRRFSDEEENRMYQEYLDFGCTYDDMCVKYNIAKSTFIKVRKRVLQKIL